METSTEEAPGRPTVAVDRSRADRPLLAWVGSFLLVGALAGALSISFLRLYPIRHYTVPIGWDVSEYLWRTTMAQAVGVANVDRPLPSLATPKVGRPGFPVIAATLSSLGHVNTFFLAAALPTAMAIVIGLAAGAFVGAVLRRPWWQVVVVALAVTVSPFVVRLMQPEAYLDNMFAASVFFAAALALGLALEHRSALWAAMILLGAGAVVHWDFFLFFAAVLLAAGGLLLPLSILRWRRGEEALLDTPTARIGEGLAGGAVIGAIGIFGILRNGLPHIKESVSEFAKKLRLDLPKYRFAVTIPAAGVGLIGLLDDGRRCRDDRAGRTRTWYVAALLVGWSVVAIGGYVAYRLGDHRIPAHRFLAFALSVPVLGILGALWIGPAAVRVIAGRARRSGSASGRLVASTVVTAVIVLGVLVWDLSVGYGLWSRAQTWMDPAKIQDVGLANAYLQAAGVPADRPVVFVMNTTSWNDAGLDGHMMRAALPAARIEHAYLYDGTPAAWLAGHPVDTAVSRSYFHASSRALSQHPVVLLTASLDPQDFEAWAVHHPSMVVRGRLVVVSGPTPPPGIPGGGPPLGPPVGPLSLLRLTALSLAIIGAVGLVGLGWTLLMMGRWLRPVEAVAVAPAVGVGALVVGGLLVDAVGIRLVGVPGAATPLGVAALGYAAWLGLPALRRGRASASAAPATV